MGPPRQHTSLDVYHSLQRIRNLFLRRQPRSFSSYRERHSRSNQYSPHISYLFRIRIRVLKGDSSAFCGYLPRKISGNASYPAGLPRSQTAEALTVGIPFRSFLNDFQWKIAINVSSIPVQTACRWRSTSFRVRPPLQKLVHPMQSPCTSTLRGSVFGVSSSTASSLRQQVGI